MISRRLVGARQSRKRAGFALVYMSAVMWAMGILMFLGTATIVGALQVEKAAASVHDRLAWRYELGAQFRADVAQAMDAPVGADHARAGKTCLILRLVDGKVVIYRWENDQLERSERNGANVTRRRLPLGGEVVALEFGREGADHPVFTVRFGDKHASKPVRPQTAFAAALGGDLR